MLAQEFDPWSMAGRALKLGRASVQPGLNRRPTQVGPDDETQVIFHGEVAMLEESIMECAEADRVRQFPACVGAVGPTRDMAGDEQPGVAGVAQRTLPAMVRQCQAPQRVLAPAQPRCPHLDSNRHVGHKQRITCRSSRPPMSSRVTPAQGRACGRSLKYGFLTCSGAARQAQPLATLPACIALSLPSFARRSPAAPFNPACDSRSQSTPQRWWRSA